MDKKSIVVMGEASESGDENEVEVNIVSEVVGKPSATPVQGIIVAGEASESEEESEDSCSTASEAFYSRSGAVHNNIDEDCNSTVKYDSLLHKKLRERNISLFRAVCDHGRQCLSNSCRILNKTNQQLLVSQVEVQDAASAARKALSNLEKLNASLSIALSIPYLPNINIVPIAATSCTLDIVVEGGLVRPIAIVENATIKEKVAYKMVLGEFIKDDSMALIILTTNMTEETLQKIMHLTSAQEVANDLHKLFDDVSEDKLIYSSVLKKGILNMENGQLFRIEKRGDEADKIITFLKSEIKELKLLASKNQAVSKLKLIKEENQALRKEIDIVKNELINLQLVNGIKQVPLPEDNAKASIDTRQHTKAQCTDIKKDGEKPLQELEEKKDKVAKPKKEVTVPEEPPVDVGRLDFRVGLILEAKIHPGADTLYVEQIDVGEETPRTVISGLVNYIPLDGLQNRLVVVLCNLKPVKIRGILSQAMVMCASTRQAVEPLMPPENSVPGDVITVKGYTRNPDSVLNPKKKVFETVALDLKTNNEGIATYKEVEWTVGDKGVVKAESLTGAAIK